MLRHLDCSRNALDKAYWPMRGSGGDNTNAAYEINAVITPTHAYAMFRLLQLFIEASTLSVGRRFGTVIKFIIDSH